MASIEHEKTKEISTAVVLSVKKLPGKHTVYDIQVKNRHRFYANGLLVHNCLGRFHPHGDQSVYGAMVGLTKNWEQVALFDGDGNWGSITEPKYAAMRYTEARLSKFADEVLFNRFYMPVVEYVPNFDGSGKEPLVLPALLPVMLINGQFGIATGATSNIPSFEYKGMLKVLRAVYEGEELTAKFLYQNLKFRTTFGGAERKLTEKEDKIDRLNVFTTYKGRVTLWSNLEFDGKRTITVTELAFNKMSSILERLLKIDGVAEARDDSDKKDRFGRLVVVLKKNLQTKLYAKLVTRIDKELNVSENFNQNLTERYIDETGRSAAKVVPMNVTNHLGAWIKWRTELERKACTYWIGEDDKRIRYLELMMLAVDNRKLIIESLDRDGDRAELDAWLAKKLKIATDEAHIIYEMRIFQLRKLEKKALEAQKKEVEAHKKGLENRRKKPLPHMAKQLDDFVKLVA